MNHLQALPPRIGVLQNVDLQTGDPKQTGKELRKK